MADQESLRSRRQRWLDAARAGSDSARGRALESCRAYLLRIAEQELGSDLRAKIGASDLVQQTLQRGLERFDTFRGSRQKEFLGWLRQILLNNLRNVVRRFPRHELSLDEHESGPLLDELAAPGKSPSSEARARERNVAVERALERLEPEQRKVLRAWKEHQGSWQAIGPALGMSPDAARMAFKRIVQRLRDEVGESP